MNFIEAAKLCMEGKIIRRRCWPDGYYILKQELAENKGYTQNDILQDDWEIVAGGLLTADERSWLLSVIKPFSDYVKYIVKVKDKKQLFYKLYIELDDCSDRKQSEFHIETPLLYIDEGYPITLKERIKKCMNIRVYGKTKLFIPFSFIGLRANTKYSLIDLNLQGATNDTK